ncbi:hypothetical protein BN970_06853 [Mycolicibacterium conceptionense]|uniref:Uncharacterized protein n=1 Tax=Mycolicibacterium conceptionense TaxID=451644 RepID=A0A0U1DYG0_9MYCO|nr:hypothetical protein BN970_06853 [Mycolicibacterium conceptionense]
MTHPDNATHDGPAWSATQEWLADLDRDPDDTGYSDESDYTPEGYDPSDEPDYDDPYDGDDGSSPTPDPEEIEDYELAPPAAPTVTAMTRPCRSSTTPTSTTPGTARTRPVLPKPQTTPQRLDSTNRWRSASSPS